MMHLALSYIITLNMTSSLFYSSREVKVATLAMECFQTSRSSTSSVFENNKLICLQPKLSAMALTQEGRPLAV